jgi:hypothetical protein
MAPVAQGVQNALGVQAQHRPAMKFAGVGQGTASQLGKNPFFKTQQIAPADCRLDRAVIRLRRNLRPVAPRHVRLLPTIDTAIILYAGARVKRAFRNFFQAVKARSCDVAHHANALTARATYAFGVYRPVVARYESGIQFPSGDCSSPIRSEARPKMHRGMREAAARPRPAAFHPPGWHVR